MIFPKLYQPAKSQPKQREELSISRPWPSAYALNGPNVAASIAPISVRHRPFGRRRSSTKRLMDVVSVNTAAGCSVSLTMHAQDIGHRAVFSVTRTVEILYILRL